MKKVVLGISSSFCAHFLKGQIQFLNNKGYNVIVISAPGEEISTLTKVERARLYTVDFTKRFSLFKDFGVLLDIIKILKKERPDVINAGNPKSGFLIMLAAWIVGIDKRIFTLHGLLSDTKKGFSRYLVTMSERISCSLARKVIVVSPSLMQHAIDRKILKASKGIVIEKGSCNGIDLNHFKKSTEASYSSEVLQQEISLPTHKKVIGFVGRLSKDKGVDTLFDAFEMIKDKHPEAILLMVGPIEHENLFARENLEKLYQDTRIFYVGKVYNILPVYGLLDVLVLPSYREGFGNVLIEAAAMQIPVIAPDIPGCRDALKHDYNGYLFQKANAGELAQRIDEYLSDNTLRERHGANGRRFVEQHFNQQKIWEGQLALYQQL